MTTEDFTRCFKIYCNYLSRYSTAWSSMTHHAFTGLTKHLGSDDSTLLLSKINSEKFTIKTFLKDLLELFFHFNDCFLKKDYVIQQKNEFSCISSLLNCTIEGSLNEIIGNECKLTAEEVISLKCFKDSLDNKMNFKTIPITNYQQEIDQLKKQLTDMQKNSALSNSIDKFQNLPEDFEESKSILEWELKKKLINENHINNFKLHLSKNTAPPSLMFSRFPTPFQPCEQNYVDEYNKLIVKFQKDAMELGIKTCAEKNVKIENNILLVIDKYKEKVPNINNILSSLKNKASDLLKDRFTKSAAKINSYTPRGYNLRPRTSNTANIEENDSRSR